MSSLRNAVQRRNHRERAQPGNREKWGLLEKHKDYSLRAKDYNEKKARLRILRQKATERNPDEFNYGMLSSRSKDGKKLVDRGNPVLSHDAVKLLKTQDSGYLRTILQKTRRAIERLEEEFVLREGEGPDVLGLNEKKGLGQHIIFVESKEQQRNYVPGTCIGGENSAIKENEDEEIEGTMPQSTRQRSRRAIEKEEAALREERHLREQHRKEQDARRSKLTALKAREKDLIDAENELESQRAKMSNSIGGITKAGVKWKVRERKR